MPQPVGGLSAEVTAVAAGAGSSCAVLSTGGLMCWGFNGSGILGDGTQADRSTAGFVTGLTSGVTSVSLGYDWACAAVDGGVQCWGNLVWPPPGVTKGAHTTPVSIIAAGSGVTSVAVGSDHTCALFANGTVDCWGLNGDGQLGDGTNLKRLTPGPVANLVDAVAISSTENFTCALTTGGSVQCWGINLNGQLGDGTTQSHNVPTPVVGLPSGVAGVSAGKYHTCAVMTDGRAFCWGDRFALGSWTTDPYALTPVEIYGL
jgi:alpha-tubulin suppressor-like RCC1 family protein